MFFFSARLGKIFNRFNVMMMTFVDDVCSIVEYIMQFCSILVWKRLRDSSKNIYMLINWIKEKNKGKLSGFI